LKFETQFQCFTGTEIYQSRQAHHDFRAAAIANQIAPNEKRKTKKTQNPNHDSTSSKFTDLPHRECSSVPGKIKRRGWWQNETAA